MYLKLDTAGDKVGDAIVTFVVFSTQVSKNVGTSDKKVIKSIVTLHSAPRQSLPLIHV